MEPIVQLIHVSDLHVTRSPVPPNCQKILGLTRWMPLLGPMFRKGMAGHDPRAPRAFRTLLKRIRNGGPDGFAGPTCIVDTGDLTTFGDDKSLADGQKMLHEFASLVEGLVSIHGNHDAWPTDFPGYATAQEVAQHRQNLRDAHFTDVHPSAPKTWPAPSGPEVHLYCCNSILHNRAKNSLALGEIHEDQYWRSGRKKPLPLKQLEQLDALVAKHTSNKPTLRILLTHHPLHFPSVKPWDSLSNGPAVAAYTVQNRLLAHLILSGHTHELFPALGGLHANPSLCVHPPLGKEQAQFVIGALMQDRPKRDKGDFKPGDVPPHQAQVLRIHWSVMDRCFVVERIVFAKYPHETGYEPRAKSPGLPATETLRIVP